MDVYKQLGKRIRKLRLEKGWSQEQLSFEADLHRTYISHLEQGKRQISVETLCRIAQGLGISSSELIKGIDL